MIRPHRVASSTQLPFPAESSLGCRICGPALLPVPWGFFPALSIPARKRYNELSQGRSAVFFSAAGRKVSPLNSEVSCHVVQRYEYIQCRVDPELRQRLAHLREERDVNISAWLRRVISEALDREFPSPGPIPGWKPSLLPDDSWGGIFRGKTALPCPTTWLASRAPFVPASAPPGPLPCSRSSNAPNAASWSATPASPPRKTAHDTCRALRW